MQTTIRNLAAACLLTLLPLGAVAGSEQEELEARMKAASKQLEIAAKELAELYATKYRDKGKDRAMLGILLGEDTPGGVGIVGTTPKGGAAEAGMEPGDLITRIDGKDLTRDKKPLAILSKHMRTRKPGDVVAIEYVRDGKKTAVDIKTRAHRQHMIAMVEEGLGNFDFDFDFSDVTSGCDDPMAHAHAQVSTHTAQLVEVSGDLARYFDVDEGVVLFRPTGEDSELRAGDVLLAVADQPIAGVEDAVRALAPLKEQVEVRVKRRGRNRTVSVAPGEIEPLVRKEVKVIKKVKD